MQNLYLDIYLYFETNLLRCYFFLDNQAKIIPKIIFVVGLQ